MPLDLSIVSITNITDPSEALTTTFGVDTEGGSASVGDTLSFASVGDVPITIDEAVLNDDPGGTLSSAITLNGTPYPAGTVLETDYSFVAYDTVEDLYFLVSHISIGNQYVGAVVSRGFDQTLDAFTDLYTPGNALSVIDPDLVPSAPGWDGFIQGEEFNTGNDQLYDNDIDIFDNPGLVMCFAAGTRICTVEGREQRVETLRPGQNVRCNDGTSQKILWVGSSPVTQAQLARHSELRPIRFAAGSLGSGLPRRDLWVSRQHRMVVSSAIVERMFGVRDVFIPAFRLVGLPGIDVDLGSREVTYIHLLLEGHQVVLAEGAPSESLLLGDQAVSTLSPFAAAELYHSFMDTAFEVSPACPIPPGQRQRQLVERHRKNGKPLLSINDVSAKASQECLGPSQNHQRSNVAKTGAWSEGFSQPRASRKTRLECAEDAMSGVAQI